MSIISDWKYRRERKRERKQAKALGTFWKECPLCEEEFGGHEWQNMSVEMRVFVREYGEDRQYEGLCPLCCYEGRGHTMDEALDDIEQQVERTKRVDWPTGDDGNFLVTLDDDELLG